MERQREQILQVRGAPTGCIQDENKCQGLIRQRIGRLNVLPCPRGVLNGLLGIKILDKLDAESEKVGHLGG